MAISLQEPTETGSNRAPTLDAITERQRVRSIARKSLRKLTFTERRGTYQGLYECGDPLPDATAKTLDTYKDGRVVSAG